MVFRHKLQVCVQLVVQITITKQDDKFGDIIKLLIGFDLQLFQPMDKQPTLYMLVAYPYYFA